MEQQLPYCEFGAPHVEPNPYALMEFNNKPCGHARTLTVCKGHWDKIFAEAKDHTVTCAYCRKHYNRFKALTNWKLI